MGKLQNFSIEFESPYGVCFAGQAVVGNVIIQITESTKLTGVRLKLLGEAKVSWTEHESHGAGKDRTTRTVHYGSEELYMNEQVYLVGSSGGASYQMEPGTHKYPFSFTLPSNVPSSFEGYYGYVRYTAKATMDRPWKFDHVTRCAFTVISLLDLNLEQPQFKEACQLSNDKVVSCCCWRSGTISATLRLHKRCYVPGETIFISAEIVNNSNSEISKTRATLKQHVEYKGQRHGGGIVFQSSFGGLKQMVNDMVVYDGTDVIAPGTTGRWENVPMVVPPIAPSRLDGCYCISVGYMLELSVKAPWTNLIVPAEIVIGTVPLREAVHYQAPLPLNAIVAGQAASAPPVDQFASDNFQIMPPSYEECPTAGRVDIATKDENEYVRGERHWGPRYPMYRQLSQPQGPNEPPLAPSQVNVGNV